MVKARSRQLDFFIGQQGPFKNNDVKQALIFFLENKSNKSNLITKGFDRVLSFRCTSILHKITHNSGTLSSL